VLIAVFGLFQNSIIDGLNIGLNLPQITTAPIQSFETLEVGGCHRFHIFAIIFRKDMGV
jgi:hypothetical protein